MQTEIRRGRKEERDSAREEKRARRGGTEGRGKRESGVSESTVASGSRSTDSAQRISILYLAKGATNHLGRLSGIPRAQRAQELLSLPCCVPLSSVSLSLSSCLSLSLMLRASQTVPEQAHLLFLRFSLPSSRSLPRSLLFLSISL